MLAALAEDKKRSHAFHEVPGRFEADRLLRIRADVSFQMMCEQINAADVAPGRKPQEIPREEVK